MYVCISIYILFCLLVFFCLVCLYLLNLPAFINSKGARKEVACLWPIFLDLFILIFNLYSFLLQLSCPNRLISCIFSNSRDRSSNNAAGSHKL